MPKFKVEHSLEKASELDAERMAVLSNAMKSTSEVMEQEGSHTSQGQEVAPQPPPDVATSPPLIIYYVIRLMKIIWTIAKIWCKLPGSAICSHSNEARAER